jgi:hypothetical protein
MSVTRFDLFECGALHRPSASLAEVCVQKAVLATPPWTGAIVGIHQISNSLEDLDIYSTKFPVIVKVSLPHWLSEIHVV